VFQVPCAEQLVVGKSFCAVVQHIVFGGRNMCACHAKMCVRFHLPSF
jgi:hypothetical protein